MCDYSLQAVKSRPAVVGERLVTHNFGTGTGGFAGADDSNVAVCVLPGTELAFHSEIRTFYNPLDITLRTAIFRQIDKEKPMTHHDCLEFPNGDRVMLTALAVGQTATVLQLPAAPKNEAEAEEQRRAEVVG